MPIYEYECTKCGKRSEKLIRNSEEPSKICLNCGAEIIKVISSPAIQFKGSGWYINDYQKKEKDLKLKSFKNSECAGCDTKCAAVNKD